MIHTTLRKQLFCLLLLCAVAVPAVHAQEDDMHVKEPKSKGFGNPLVFDGSHFTALGLTLGTNGIGIQSIYAFNNYFDVRVGVAGIPPFNYTRTDMVGSTNLEQTYRTSFLNIHALFDYYLPIMTKAGFRITAGAAWFVHAKSEVTSKPVGEYYYGDINVNDDRMGTIVSDVRRNGIAPYAGIGFLNLINTKRIQVSLDLGSYFLVPDASVNMKTSGYLLGNERNEEALAENLKEYRWLPTVQFGVYWKFMAAH